MIKFNKDSPINYQYHIKVIVVLLLIQFFIPDIASYLFLNVSKSYYSKRNAIDGILYNRNEYSPLTERAFSEHPDFEFVFVKEKGEITEELYFFPNGNKSIARYVDGKWKSTSSSSLAVAIPFMMIPGVGFILWMIAIFGKIGRTGAFITWDLMKHPDSKLERICKLYAIPLWISAIVFGYKLC